MKIITVSKKSVRFLPKTNMFRMNLEYTTSKGNKKWFSHLAPTKVEAEKELNFRLAGLKNGGCEVVMLKK